MINYFLKFYLFILAIIYVQCQYGPISQVIRKPSLTWRRHDFLCL